MASTNSGMNVLNDLLLHQPHIIFTCGLPGTGKSTWTRYWCSNHAEQNYIVCSTDDIIEREGARYGWRYNDSFENLDKEYIEDIFFHEFANALNGQRNIVIDQTNLTWGSRNKKIMCVPTIFYRTACIVFQCSYLTMLRRLNQRFLETQKYISLQTIEKMSSIYEAPEEDEFDYLCYIYERL